MTESFRAIVRSPVAPLFDEPRISSVQISQLLAGHAVEVLDERDAWRYVRGLDLYEGWMHSGYLHADLPLRGERNALHVSLGCVVARERGRCALPLGAYLDPDDEVLHGETVVANRMAERFPRDAAAITHSAREFFQGASYLWGGVTPWGADCSGLVQATFALHGVPLPRDAWQQARQGVAADPDPLAACEGDLLFFSDRADRHITHVAISLGRCAIVHLALGRGGFGIEQLDASGDAYVESLLERFTTARRVL